MLHDQQPDFPLFNRPDNVLVMSYKLHIRVVLNGVYKFVANLDNKRGKQYGVHHSSETFSCEYLSDEGQNVPCCIYRH